MPQWPVYVSFVLSSLQVGVVWFNHHTMFHYIRRSDHLLKVLNLLFLLCAALLPFTTALVSEYARSQEDRRIAAQLYSGVLALSGLFFNAMWRHALRARLVDPRVDPNRRHALTWHRRLVPVCYGLAFLLAYIEPRISLLMYVLLLLYYSLPGPAVVRWLTGRRAAAVLRGRALEGAAS